MARLDGLRLRAGQLFCACGSDGMPLAFGSLPKAASTQRLVLAFGLAIFSQVLIFSSLPLASFSIAPTDAAVAFPFAALLLGSALASFPASLLMDMFGRRSAFALGASLGVAGGLLCAFAVSERQFLILVLGALWLGMAQGFALFYRHAAALAGGSGILVFGGGVIGAALGPFAVVFLSSQGGPFALAWLLAAAGLVNLIPLWLATGLPAVDVSIEAKAERRASQSRIPFAIATGLAALAWMGMNGLMAKTPLMMQGCGLGFGMTAAAMASHLVAMYVPSFMIGRLIQSQGGAIVALEGLALLAIGALGVLNQNTVTGFSLALALAGFGWGTATIGAMATIHRTGPVPPHWLALHDTLLFLAALCGALVFGQPA